MAIMDVEVDEERCESLYAEMLEEALKTRQFSGTTRLQFELKLREAVWQGAMVYETKKAKGLV